MLECSLGQHEGAGEIRRPWADEGGEGAQLPVRITLSS
jgi:hypothetical protein